MQGDWCGSWGPFLVFAHTEFVRGENKPIAAPVRASAADVCVPLNAAPRCPWGVRAVAGRGAVAGLRAGSRNRGRSARAAPDTPHTPRIAPTTLARRGRHTPTAAARLPSGPREGLLRGLREPLGTHSAGLRFVARTTEDCLVTAAVGPGVRLHIVPEQCPGAFQPLAFQSP